MGNKRRDVDDETRHYCKPCALWLANNRAQRDQHERGTKHKAAVVAMLADIALRNAEKRKEQARVAAAISKLDAAAAAAAPTATPLPGAERADLLSRIAAATSGRALGGNLSSATPPQARLQSEGADVIHRAGMHEGADDVAKVDAFGYGKWEEVVDVAVPGNVSSDEDCGAAAGGESTDVSRALKRRVRKERRIGAVDAGDDEEAAALEDARVAKASNGLDAVGEGGAISFKARGGRRIKRRRRDDE
jgi:U1 zinc finger